MDDLQFVDYGAARLAGLPGVCAVSLGGSRVSGTHTPSSDWDFALYYSGRFDPEDLRSVGWAGTVSEIGVWGGVFNGGAWLEIDGRRMDVHYRDLGPSSTSWPRHARGGSTSSRSCSIWPAFPGT